MIGFNFDYYQPESISKSLQLYRELIDQHQSPRYLSGGTELITMARTDKIKMDAVIDISRIPESLAFGFYNHNLVIGSALSLTKLTESSAFPLLAVTGGRVADHTARNQITIGGNICGKIPYREAVLPFLLAESKVVIAASDHCRIAPIMNLFHQQLMLNDGEWLVQVLTDRHMLSLPFYSVKRCKLDLIDYPLLTLAAIKKDYMIRVAFSGLCAFPFRSRELEAILNNLQIPFEERIQQVIDQLPAPVLDNVQGSADYRTFVLKNTLTDMFLAFESEGIS